MTPIGAKLLQVNGKPVNETVILLGWSPRFLGDADVLIAREGGGIEQHRLSRVQISLPFQTSHLKLV